MKVSLRHATVADAGLLARWDKEPHVIAAVTDNAGATEAFAGASWPDELAMQSEVFQYCIAEVPGEPICAMLIIDPHLEPNHYWGDIEPNLRALDIWIGRADCLGKGYGSEMMRLALDLCFRDGRVTAVLVDPLASNTRVHTFYQRLGFTPLGRRILPPEDECLVHSLTRDAWRASLSATPPTGQPR